MKRLSILIFLILSISMLFSGCKNINYYKTEVKQIYLSYNIYEARINRECKIDFENKLIYYFCENNLQSFRNKKAENEGYQEVTKLEQDNVDNFFINATKAGIFNLKNKYECKVKDGYSWSIEITYKNGTIKKSYGHYRYPKNRDEICKVLYELTGKKVLQ